MVTGDAMTAVVRKRAVALTELLCQAFRERGHSVEIDHRHVHLPRVLGPAARTEVHS